MQYTDSMIHNAGHRMELTLGTWRISISRTPPTDAALSQQYTRAADHWDRSLHYLGYPAAYRSLFQQLVRDGTLQGVPASGRVLDCGVGTGALSRALVEQTSADLHITGVDIAQGMLDRAREVFQAAGIRANLLRRSICDLDDAAGSFDLVMGAHILEHLPDPSVGLRTMVQALRPGAPLVLIITRTSPASLWLNLKWHIHRTSPVDLITMMHDVGLTDVRLCPLAGPPWCRWMSMACVGTRGK